MIKDNIIRLKALIRKEGQQMLRDSSALTLGIVLPLILLLLFGFGLSFNITNVPVTLIYDTSSALTRDLYNSLKLSPSISPAIVHSWQEAEERLSRGQTQVIVRRAFKDFSDGREHIQIVVNGRDSNTATIMQSYVEGAVSHWISLNQSSRAFLSSPLTTQTVNMGSARPELRVWYNSEMESRYFLIPGVTALIMTLIGTLLTALIIAREWERGTYEALIATPVQSWEILLGKIIPYFLLGLIGLALCLIAAISIFDLPVRSPIWLIILISALYLLVALGLGLCISAITKSQFLASQVAIILSFLPTVMLSGFIFDLRSAPKIAYYFAHIFPATWYVDMLQTLFLVGPIPQILTQNTLILTGFTILLFLIAHKKINKSLE